MPDIQIRVQVVGSDQAIGDLNKVGSAAKSAGKSAAAGGGGILSFAGKAAGAATGAMALTNGLFGIQDAMDNVSKSDLNLARAHRRTEIADRALAKAQEAVKKELQDTTKTVRDNNGAVGQQTEHILSYNEATGEAIIQTKTANGEFKISTKNIKENSVAYQNLKIAQDGSTNAHETENQAIRENTQVHQRLIPTIAGEALQVTLGALAIAPFVQKLFQMATGGKAAATGVKTVSDALSGFKPCAEVPCTEKAAGAMGQLGAQAVRSAVPIRAFTAGVAIVGGGAGLMATNLFGARDAIGGMANAIQNADVKLKPLGLGIDGLMKQAKILPDPFNKANQEIGTGTEGISTKIMRMGQVGSQGITFLTRGFEQFSTQIAAGNLGGAIDTAIAGITKGLDKLKNINFPSSVTINWAIKNIWPALQTIFADLKAAWGVVSTSYNATINWLATHVWPTVQDAYAKLRQTWGNVVTAYNATINWLATHVWPALADAYAKLRQTWGNVVTVYNATVNWLVIHVWPIVQDAYAKLRQTWGNVIASYNATVNWLVIHVWPALANAYAKLRQTWGNVLTSYNATINWAVMYNWPPLANAYGKLREVWGNAVTAYNATVNWLVIYVWPPLAEAYAKLRQTWGNVNPSYNATINWSVGYNWPTLAQVTAALKIFWGPLSLPYDAAIDLSKSKFDWPDVGKAAQTWAASVKIPNLDNIWTSIKAGIRAAGPMVPAFIWSALNLAAKGGTFIVPPEVEQKILAFVKQYQAQQAASKAPTIGQLGGGTPTADAYTRYQQQQLIAGRAPVKHAATGGSFIVDKPTSLGNNLTVGEGFNPELLTFVPLANSGGAGILNIIPLKGAHAPSKITKNMGLRKTWLGGPSVPIGSYSYGSGSLNKKAATGGSFVVSKPTQFGNVSVGEGYKPELLTFIPFGDAVGGGILNVIPLTRKPRDYSSGRHFAAGGTAIIGDLSAGIAKSTITLGVEVDSKDAEAKVSQLKNKINNTLPEERKTVITAEASGFEGAVTRITGQLNQIPKETRSTASMDVNSATSAINSFKSILSSIPAIKTITLAITQTGSTRVGAQTGGIYPVSRPVANSIQAAIYSSPPIGGAISQALYGKIGTNVPPRPIYSSGYRTNVAPIGGAISQALYGRMGTNAAPIYSSGRRTNVAPIYSSGMRTNVAPIYSSSMRTNVAPIYSSSMRTNVAPTYTSGPSGAPGGTGYVPHSIVYKPNPYGSVVFPFYYVDGRVAYKTPTGFRAEGSGQLIYRFAQGGNVLMHNAARGGSFIVDHLMQFGNITVGEGRNPELLTLFPLPNGNGILQVIPLTGVNAPSWARGMRGMRDGGEAMINNSHMFSALGWAASRAGGPRGEGRGGAERLMALLEKFIALQVHGRGLEANFNVDGQRMSSVIQRYMGSKSYGDR